MVKHGASSQKQTILTSFSKKNYLGGYQNHTVLVQQLLRFCWMFGFCLLVEFHREGSASAAAAVLSYQRPWAIKICFAKLYSKCRTCYLFWMNYLFTVIDIYQIFIQRCFSDTFWSSSYPQPQEAELQGPIQSWKG